MTHGSENLFRQQQAITQPSIDGNLIYGTRAYDQNRRRKLCWKTHDEYGTHRNEHGNAQADNGRRIPMSSEDTNEILKRAKMDKQSTIDLPDYADGYKQSRPEPELYKKDEINELLTGIHGDQ